MTKTKAMPANKVVTGEVRFSYAHVWEPDSINGSDPKYSVSILIPKSDTKTINMINKAIEAAKEMGKSEKFGGKIPANLKLPLRDGDEDRPDERGVFGALLRQRQLQDQARHRGQKLPAHHGQHGVLQRLLWPRLHHLLSFQRQRAIAALPAD